MIDFIKDFPEDGTFPTEGESVTGNSRTESRLCAIQAIFQFLLIGRTMADIEKDFLKYQINQRKADKKPFTVIINDVAKNKERYEEMISGSLGEGWTYDRVGFLEKSILLSAVGEFFAVPNTPMKVVLNEFINISKMFLDEKDVRFINGILNNMAVRIRPAESGQRKA